MAALATTSSSITGAPYLTSVTSTAPTHFYVITGGTGGTVVAGGGGSSVWSDLSAAIRLRGRLNASIGDAFEIALPDGGVFECRADGSYRVRDADARVTYAAARHREFNRYLNASDLVAEFIEAVGLIGLTSREILKVPVELLIAFLVVRAAEADGEDVPVRERSMLDGARDAVLRLPAPAPAPRGQNRCACCGRFFPKAMHSSGLMHCTPEHAAEHHRRITCSSARDTTRDPTMRSSSTMRSEGGTTS